MNNVKSFIDGNVYVRAICKRCNKPTDVYQLANSAPLTVVCALCILDEHEVLKFLNKRSLLLPEGNSADYIACIGNAQDKRHEQSDNLFRCLREVAIDTENISFPSEEIS